jgi:predicted transcriptional regulator
MNRSRFKIMAEILQACCVPQGKTRIMCKVKLNFPQAKEYLSQLTSVWLLSKVNMKYETTAKGREFIAAYNRLGEIMGIPNLLLTGMKFLTPMMHAKRNF